MSSDFGSEWRLQRQKISMSERAGRIDDLKFLQETACVHIEEREFIAFCKAFLVFFPKSKMRGTLEKKFMASALIVGRGRWYRDTITDLGFALSKSTKEPMGEDASAILDAEVR